MFLPHSISEFYGFDYCRQNVRRRGKMKSKDSRKIACIQRNQWIYLPHFSMKALKEDVSYIITPATIYVKAVIPAPDKKIRGQAPAGIQNWTGCRINRLCRNSLFCHFE
jgi:hypothetical protein